MKTNTTSMSRCFAIALMLMLVALSIVMPRGAVAAPTDLANGPLASGVTGSTAVKPNIAFIMDDSGSMNEEGMPNDGNVNRSSRCWGWHGYNTLFYNPDYTYKPPFLIGGATYSDSVTRFPDANFADALSDGYFPRNGGVYSGNGTNTSTNLSVLNNLTPNAVSCDPGAGSQGYPAKATIVFEQLRDTRYYVSSLMVSGVQLLDSTKVPGTSTKDTDDLGKKVAASINNRKATTGFSARYDEDNNTLTITADMSKGNLTALPDLVRVKTNNERDRTVTIQPFSGYVAPGVAGECPASPSKYYYSTHKTNPNSNTCESASNYNITTDANKIEAPGIPVLGASGTGRTAAEIAAAQANYANWYTYYRKRATLMKAAAGEAFKDLDQSKYRIGLFFINSIESGAGNNNNDLRIDDFTGTASGAHRKAWYDRLYGGRGGGTTPLLGALSRAGRMFTGQISGFDPLQYSCQQNFAILSTDGYWNASSASYGPHKPKDPGSNTLVAVGNQDGTTGTASASIVLEELGTSTYYASSLKVGTTELLRTAEVPTGGTAVTDVLGSALVNSINANSGTTGYSALYDGNTNTLTVTAPASAGELTVTPGLTTVKVGAGANRTATISPFSNGAKPPFRDALNISNTLADVAYYYYTNDLRDLTKWSNCSNTIDTVTYPNLCENNVLGSGKDVNSKQHMTTFTLGLGVSGTIQYESNYENATDDPNIRQYVDIKNGTINWPNPNSSDKAKIDDLWHAAVNGRGTYYSASNAQTLRDGIQAALSGVQARTGSSAAAATSNLEPVAGDNFVYVALYRTQKWDGDLKAFEINPDSGALDGAAIWSAQEELDQQVTSNVAAHAAATAAATPANPAPTTPPDGRNIKFFSSSVTGNLKNFTLGDLEADGLHTHFQNVCGVTKSLTQCAALTVAQKATADSADNLINYLRGQPAYEADTNIADPLYRGRDHVLGDVVNAVPVYMKKPPFGYDAYDTTYAAFKTANVNRAATVYVAANDGMLHAFNADKDDAQVGKERWAYVPKMVMGNMWRLADSNYANNHLYFVDGSPTLADVCENRQTGNTPGIEQLCRSASDWKTILVGGLNKGGCGYYALDVTDPTQPKGLWEFTNPNLGYSYGNPVVAKRGDGRWVVIFTSGYNNIPNNGCGATGDGNGHVFVVDAITGELLGDIQTYTSGALAAGSVDTPNGLAKLNAWIDDAALPIAKRLYGGDLLGNVWRIDYDNKHEPSGTEAVLLAQLKDRNNIAQPITVKPELGEITMAGAHYPVVFVGTGKYLGNNDPRDTNTQTIYAIKDSLGSTGIGDARGAGMVKRTLAETSGSADGALSGRTIRTVSGDNINWASDNGWYLDLNPNGSSPGERVNVDMSLQFNMLTVAANVPSENVCDVGGYAFLYFLDINTGKNMSTAVDGMAGIRLTGNALVAGIKTVRLTSGKTVTIVTDTAGNVSSEDNPGTGSGLGAGARRTTWREIAD